MLVLPDLPIKFHKLNSFFPIISSGEFLIQKYESMSDFSWIITVKLLFRMRHIQKKDQ